MVYKPIYESHELSDPGPLPEDLRFDMKMMLPRQAADVVLACDVAAFANAAGGVLLIGAHEHPNGSGRLNAYVPMTFDEANAVGTVLGNALRLCSPRPIASAQVIPLKDDPDKYVVAVNCEPYAAPPIGVAQAKDGGEKCWMFPVRRGKDVRNLRPEELATIMDPKLRRVLLLLEKVPTYEDHGTRRAYFHSRTTGVDVMDILNVDPIAMALHLIRRSDSREVIVPLDAVEMVWRDLENGMFNISLYGSLFDLRGKLQFAPL